GFYSLESDRGCWTEDKSVSPNCCCALRVAVVGNRLFVCRAVSTDTAVPHIRFTGDRVLPLGLASGFGIGKPSHAYTHGGSRDNQETSLGIYNGKKTTIAKFPFMVSVLVKNVHFGSGVILNTHWILTTGFNVNWYPLKDLSFRVGSTNCEKGGQLFTADKVLANENYTGSWDYDIAVVKLNKPIKFSKYVKPIKLGTASLKPTTKVVIAGWGPESKSEIQSMTLLTAKVTVYAQNQCERTYSSDLTPRLMCTYDTNVGPCASDFGDPLVYKNAVYGLYAGAYNCLSDPAVYVNVPILVDWVKSVIKE
ncbi:trypsin-3-like, partial [Homalodisca vitripennis]|uniref:trypsin-3-like n=1 Tax=Homalodisca vitripennis TaxID=197043 RepID=UPI001EEBA0D3